MTNAAGRINSSLIRRFACAACFVGAAGFVVLLAFSYFFLFGVHGASPGMYTTYVMAGNGSLSAYFDSDRAQPLSTMTFSLERRSMTTTDGLVWSDVLSRRHSGMIDVGWRFNRHAVKVPLIWTAAAAMLPGWTLLGRARWRRRFLRSAVALSALFALTISATFLPDGTVRVAIAPVYMDAQRGELRVQWVKSPLASDVVISTQSNDLLDWGPFLVRDIFVAGITVAEAQVYASLFTPLACAPFAILLITYVRTRPRATSPDYCRTCRYDLRATPDRCPECGTVPDRPIVAS